MLNGRFSKYLSGTLSYLIFKIFLWIWHIYFSISEEEKNGMLRESAQNISLFYIKSVFSKMQSRNRIFFLLLKLNSILLGHGVQFQIFCLSLPIDDNILREVLLDVSTSKISSGRSCEAFSCRTTVEQEGNTFRTPPFSVTQNSM